MLEFCNYMTEVYYNIQIMSRIINLCSNKCNIYLNIRTLSEHNVVSIERVYLYQQIIETKFSFRLSFTLT